MIFYNQWLKNEYSMKVQEAEIYSMSVYVALYSIDTNI